VGRSIEPCFPFYAQRGRYASLGPKRRQMCSRNLLSTTEVWACDGVGPGANYENPRHVIHGRKKNLILRVSKGLSVIGT
jgi:hypothetical protein